jgi:uncharacterized cupredoxin-like copper-binding protein
MGYQHCVSFEDQAGAAGNAAMAGVGVAVNLTASFTPVIAHVFPTCVLPGHAGAGVGDVLRRRAVSTAVARPGSDQY